MRRRSYLGCIAATGLTIISGCSELDSVLGSQYIEEHYWDEQDRLVLVFEEDHDTDGWAILHEHHSSIDDAIMSGESPDFDGPLRLDFISEIQEGDYPSLNFNLNLYEGHFGPSLSLAEEELGSHSFEVPEDKVPGTVLSG